MRTKEFVWHVRPGVSVVDVMRAFKEHGVGALRVYDSTIHVKKNLGSKAVRIKITVERSDD